jgi:SAM-dependent methyltransferase
MNNPNRELPPAAYSYDTAFMELAEFSNSLSARAIIAAILQHVAVGSVLDVGCATGTWLCEWKKAGVVDIRGIDGSYVERARLRINDNEFMAMDLSQPFDLGRRFDLVQSLEVAEHLPPASSGRFVESLVRHARGLIVFSAAPPGQGGEFHINEKSYAYWRGIFEQHDYRPFDLIRPIIAALPEISYWYRYNILLYVREDRIEDLPAAVKAARVPDNAPILDVSPGAFRLRKLLLRLLPYTVQHGLARLKSRVLPRGRF